MQIKINGQTISLAAPEPFLSILRREKIYFPLYCGGRGTCGKCRIRITEGSLPITTEDRQFFSEDELKAGYPVSRFGTLGLFKADKVPEVEPIIVEKPGVEVGYGAIGIGEITSIPTAPAIAGAYYRWNKDFQTKLPLVGTPYEKKKK